MVKMKNNTRTCIASHKVYQKEELIRVVKTKNNNFEVDSQSQGRGCYISKVTNPDEIMKKRLLHRAFKMEVPKEIYEELVAKLKGDKHE